MMFNSDCPYNIPNSLWKHGTDCCPIVSKISVRNKFYNHVFKICKLVLVDVGFETMYLGCYKSAWFRLRLMKK